jgi:hypothetical protein
MGKAPERPGFHLLKGSLLRHIPFNARVIHGTRAFFFTDYQWQTSQTSALFTAIPPS